MLSSRQPAQLSDAHVSAIDSMAVFIAPLRAFSRSFRLSHDESEDLVQETLTRAIGAIHLFTPGTNMKSWLFTIMRNAFYSRRRKAGREAPGKLDCISTLDIPTAPSQEWSCHAADVREALERLNDSQRQALVLVTLAGLSYAEAADVCGCDIGTIKSRLSRARQNLITLLGEPDRDSAVGHAGHLSAAPA